MIGRVFVVISGLPGTGKSAVARAVAMRLGAVHLSIDPVENAMLGVGLDEGWATGVAAYEAVRVMAEDNLTLGRSVVVDAVNDSEAARTTWRNAANTSGIPVTFVLLTVPNRGEHRRRLEGRDRGMVNVGEPTWDQVLSRAEAYEPWTGLYSEIDASAPLNDVIDQVLTALG